MTATNHPGGLAVFGHALAANEYATFDLILHITDAANPKNQNFKFVGPAGCSWTGFLAATVIPGSTQYTYGAADILANRYASATAACLVTIRGTVVNAGTAGNFELQIAQGTSSASAVTLKKGASFTLNRSNW